MPLLRLGLRFLLWHFLHFVASNGLVAPQLLHTDFLILCSLAISILTGSRSDIVCSPVSLSEYRVPVYRYFFKQPQERVSPRNKACNYGRYFKSLFTVGIKACRRCNPFPRGNPVSRDPQRQLPSRVASHRNSCGIFHSCCPT